MYFTISTYFLAECGLVAAYQNFVQNQPTPPLQRTTFLCLSLVQVRYAAKKNTGTVGIANVSYLAKSVGIHPGKCSSTSSKVYL